MQRVIFILSAAILFAMPSGIRAQIQIGTVQGIVNDALDAHVRDAIVVIKSPVKGDHNRVATDERGQFIFNNVPFGSYTLEVSAAGFQPAEQSVTVRSNIPVTLTFKLAPAGITATLDVQAGARLVEGESTSTATELNERLIRSAPGVLGSNRLQRLIATTAGWMTENNGLLHIRGVDDGILYVVDGIPTPDRLDTLSASAFDTDSIQSLNVITGNIPAEFGGRSGAVVVINPKSGIDLPWAASISAGAGSFQTSEIEYSLGAGINKKFGFYVTNSASRSGRFLDPVDPRNFNNRAGRVNLNIRSDWHPTARDIFLFNISANGTDFRVPNDLEQELAGQRQRQELRDNSQSVSWQHIGSAATVINAAYFRRSYQSELFGSEFDIPIFAAQERKHVRQGIIASLTHLHKGHTLKAGIEGSRNTPREFFTFAITDGEEAERREVSEAALTFGAGNPFVFRDSKTRGQISWYVQDAFSPVRNLTINAGLRYDHSSLLARDRQFSPRVGAVYFVAATGTAIRGSFNRLFMPPQIENLLLASSEQARRLSPFASSDSAGGAPIHPEKQSAYEVGFAQDVFGWFKLDAAYWYRQLRNAGDPNVFFNTTIIFPNSVAKGMARGVDARLDVPERRGWSGYLSFTNSRILQTGPINGGLFLTDEFIEIGPGTRFIPDHDQRNVAAFGLLYRHRRSGLWASLSGRHESGTPLEVEEDRLEDLREAIGSNLVNFARGRVRPWTVFDAAMGADLLRGERVGVSLQFDVQNITDKRFAYNFGSPFEGTHFGHPRMWGGRIEFVFR